MQTQTSIFYIGYTAVFICSAFLLTPVALAVLGALSPDSTFIGTFKGAMEITKEWLLFPICLYGLIISGIIRIFNLRRTPSGQVASVVISVLPAVCLFCALIAISNSSLSAKPADIPWITIIFLLTATFAIPAALLSFLLPKPDAESETSAP